MIRVTIEDLETGETNSREIWDDFMLVCAGNKYLDGIQQYGRIGTTVLTIKTDQGEGDGSSTRSRDTQGSPPGDGEAGTG